MKFHIQSTIFGQLVRFVAGNKVFQYPDEINPLLWKAATQQSCARQLQPQETTNSTGNEPNKEAQDAAAQGRQMQDGDDDTDTLIVCWYGPDDEEVCVRSIVFLTVHLLTQDFTCRTLKTGPVV